ncbi:hypothetical protein IVB14_15455 [Bradyrhizobium sp. 180]|uniref:hypothetical protein n=1 Tax=unclassified Bradyrhizobium TaxID=2631580 RepID=UPI001FFB6D61|nr:MULTISPECIES: hypothetical protein [unclassified Bradyrhizobium]MCK1425325.1 hypothetical protein [Bradyrhizobium sp. CW12]MCK1491782.1 hypothetical protein [Bradyrhizobium sp. 180]MCK1530359.1 hypothetical protein [Bradyrhizobium sp. 182]MCK1596710.1 hypothetical protein [Bradyrhizobium sp. 164]MCK1644218.1 hypothetical protein [Bradyrhizobium sp. 154]
MRRTPRLIAAAVLIAFTGVLGGCSSFDPSDMLDFLDTKKKLPGDRKPVFPEGVPGLEQGVPKEMYKGAQQQPDPNAPAVAALPAEPPPEPAKPVKGAKATKSRQPAAAAAAPAGAEVDGEAQPEAAPSTAAPSPKHKIVRKRTTAPPPDQPVQQAQPTQTTQQQSQGAFPAPLPSGSFSR